MTTTVPAIYDHGVFRPLTKIPLTDHQRVWIVIFPAEDDIPTFLIGEAAAQSLSFDFLRDPAEDLYRPTDGQPV